MSSFRALHSQSCEATRWNDLKHDDVRTPAFAGGNQNPALSKANVQDIRRFSRVEFAKWRRGRHDALAWLAGERSIAQCG